MVRWSYAFGAEMCHIPSARHSDAFRNASKQPSPPCSSNSPHFSPMPPIFPIFSMRLRGLGDFGFRDPGGLGEGDWRVLVDCHPHFYPPPSAFFLRGVGPRGG